MILGTHLVYDAAGRPQRADFEPIAGPCWWCAEVSPTGLGWPLKRLASTFQHADEARCPCSDSLCAACAWSMAVGVYLPADYARARLLSKAQQARRIDLEEGGERVKRLALVLDEGRIGLWATASGGKEAAWKAAAKADLSSAPRSIGPCSYLGAHRLEELQPGADRFVQSFHHMVVDGAWTACTDADKPLLRAHLLRSDIVGPACTSIVTAQGKHTLIHTQPEYPETGARGVYFGGMVWYRPSDLAELLWAYETLRLAGASREDILAGALAPRASRAWLHALRVADPIIAPHRGGRLLELTAHVARPYPEIEASPPVRPTHAQEVRHGRPDPDRGARHSTPSSPPARASHPPADRGHRPARADGQQLRLF